MDKQNVKLRFIVLSDLHAVDDLTGNGDSYLNKSKETSNFFNSFLDYIENLKFNPDLIICSGDIGNKAKEKNFKYGWYCLNELKKRLKVKHLFCVPGNHDHDSRYSENDYDPKYTLQHVSPQFPCSKFNINTHFWAWHWCHIEQDVFNVILLNSSAYHGMGSETEDYHGRVAPKISEQIINYVDSKKFKEKSINFIICHHHPCPMKVRGGDTQFMKGAENLFDDLLCKQKGAWFVIHGHRHLSGIQYAKSAVSARPVILSAGSLGKRIDNKILGETLNQFHCVEIDIEKTKRKGEPVGIYYIHTWTLSSGWEPSKLDTIPDKGGFGATDTPIELANKFKDILNNDKIPFLKDDELNTHIAEYTYFTPDDRQQFIKKLKAYNIDVVIENGEIVEIGLKKKYDKYY